MHEYEEKVKKLCETKDRICSLTDMYLSQGVDNICVSELGGLVDMIKDLVDAEKNVWKACYYKLASEELKEAKEEEEMYDPMMRMGYDNYRYASGRFAPKGRGTYHRPSSSRRGYMPMEDMSFNDMGHMIDHDLSAADHRAWNAASRYGKPYQDYQMAKRHYTETHDQHARDEMDTRAVEHMADMIATMKEIWNDATPTLKKQMAADLKGMTNGMTM